MTAAIVHSVARSIVLDAEMLEDAATMPQSAENSRRDIPGQLWERVAERGNTPLGTYSERYRNAVERAMTRDCGNHADIDVIACARGPRLGGGYSTPRARQSCNTYRMAASGIIRAGERIK